jgi:hypothetical protein
MGFFNSIFNKIGHGLSSIGHTVGHGLTSIVKPIYSHVISPVYKSVIKPAYTKVISPVVGRTVASVGRISGKALSTGEQIVNNGLDFSQRFQKQGQGIALTAESGVGSLVKMLSNPAVMVIGGIAGLIIVSKI